MNSKSTTTAEHSQHLIAGLLPEDSHIEFFGIEGKHVNWIQNGSCKTWKDIPVPLYVACMNHFNKNLKARTALKGYKENGKLVSRNRLVEIYIYLGWGSADGEPDMINGVLQPMENFRHERDCISIRFKEFKIKGKVLKPREIFMLDTMNDEDDPTDEVIALQMSIKLPTYNQHSRALKDKAGVDTKHALVREYWKSGLGQYFNRV